MPAASLRTGMTIESSVIGHLRGRNPIGERGEEPREHAFAACDRGPSGCRKQARAQERNRWQQVCCRRD
jgi:hypothetical protein